MDFLSEAFNKPPYDATYEEKFVGMDYIWYFSEGNQEYKLHFEKQIGLGKKVFRVVLGQRTAGTKAYKKIVTRFRDPFRVVATILDITAKFLDAQSGKAYGLAYALPITSFGAYKAMIAKVIQRKLLTKVELTDIAFQPTKAEEDGLYYTYMTIKPHTIKQTFDGKWFDQALIDAAKPAAAVISKDAPAVLSTAPAPTPAPVGSQKPGASHEFYAACAKMGSAKEFGELKAKFGVGTDFSYKKFGGEAFKKGSTFKWFPGWDIVEAEILNTIKSDDDKAMFRAYAIRQFYYQDRTIDNLLSLEDSIADLKRTSTYFAYTKVIVPMLEELKEDYRKEMVSLAVSAKNWLEIQTSAEALKPYKDLNIFLGSSWTFEVYLSAVEKETDDFIKMKLNAIENTVSGRGRMDQFYIVNWAGLDANDYKDENTFTGLVRFITVDDKNPCADFFKDMPKQIGLRVYQIDVNVANLDKMVETVTAYINGDIKGSVFKSAALAYIAKKGLSILMKDMVGVPANEKALASYWAYENGYDRVSGVEEVLLAEAVKMLNDKSITDNIPATKLFTDIYMVIANKDDSPIKPFAKLAFVRMMEENPIQTVAFLRNKLTSYAIAANHELLEAIGWQELMAKIISTPALKGETKDMVYIFSLAPRYENGPLPRDMEKAIEDILAVKQDAASGEAIRKASALLSGNYISKECYNKVLRPFIIASGESSYRLQNHFTGDDDGKTDDENRLGAINVFIGAPFDTKKHTPEQLTKILAFTVNFNDLSNFSTSLKNIKGSRFQGVVKLLDESNGKVKYEDIKPPYTRLCLAIARSDQTEIDKIVADNPSLKETFQSTLWSKGYGGADQSGYLEVASEIFGRKEALKMFAACLEIPESKRGAGNTIEDYERYKANFAAAIVETRYKDKPAFDEIYTTSPAATKKLLAKKAIESSFIKQTHEALLGDKVEVKPLEKPSDQRLRDILSYNRIDIPSTRIVKEFDVAELDKRINNATTIDIPDLQVTHVPKTEVELKGMSVEYDFFNKGKHGDIGIKFLKVFDVNIPLQVDGFEEFKRSKPGTQIISPAFHGTGSVAASMILRKGFAVLKAGDASVVGRMLGDGIYFSTVLDKVGQYVSDGGYSRGIGNKGYIFEMDAALGDPKVNYSSAGTGSPFDTRNGVVSPEWCVFDGNRQLRIKKAYMIELVPRAEIKKYAIKENVMTINHFDSFIKEARAKPKGKANTGAITYTFMDGSIPLTKDLKVDFEDFRASAYDGLRVEASAIGPMVVFDARETEGYAVRSTREFQDNSSELSKFLKLLKAAKKRA